LKDKTIGIFCGLKLALKYKLNHGFRTSDMSTAEFQCVNKKQYNTEAMKPNLNKNLGLPWTLQKAWRKRVETIKFSSQKKAMSLISTSAKHDLTF